MSQCFVLVSSNLFSIPVRFRNALKALQQVVLGGAGVPGWMPTLLEKLTSQDTSLLWLSYIHLVEFRFLPPSLFDPASAHGNTIVSKVSCKRLAFHSERDFEQW